MSEKYGFVYIWFDRKHHRFYIGCHWGTEDDGYICSSNWMRDAYRRRPQDFKRRMLQKTTEQSELNLLEYNWLKKIKLEELGSRYYNLKRNSSGDWEKLVRSKKGKERSVETKEKLREATLAQFRNPEKRERHRIAVIEAMENLSTESRDKLASQKGKKQSPERIEKTRQAHIGKPLSEETKRKIGKANKISLKGKKLPVEVVEKIRQANTGKKRSEEFRQRMKEKSTGRKCTEEAKRKISETKKRLYDEGKIDPPWLGKSRSEETKAKISLTKRNSPSTTP